MNDLINCCKSILLWLCLKSQVYQCGTLFSKTRLHTRWQQGATVNTGMSGKYLTMRCLTLALPCCHVALLCFLFCFLFCFFKVAQFISVQICIHTTLIFPSAVLFFSSFLCATFSFFLCHGYSDLEAL